MADTGDHAYSHALAVLLDPGRAASVAADAVREGGRSTTLVLAHAWTLALAAADAEPPPAPDLDDPAPEELGALARALTATRPASERALVDIGARHHLDRARVARILGVGADDAAAQQASVAAVWQAQLDPALLIRLGPGPCEELAAELAARRLWTPAPAGSGDDDPEATAGARGAPAPGISLGDLLAAAGPVGDHAASCQTCGDRLRAVVSVRDLMSGAPLVDAPAAVADAAARHRRGAGGFPTVADEGGRRARARVVGAMAVLVAVLLAAAVAVLVGTGGGDSADAVADLARTPASGGQLQVRPEVLRSNPLPPVVLRNESDEAVRWRVEPGVPWLTASPGDGTLDAGKGTTVRLLIGPEAPEGPVRLSVTIVGDDGSTASVRIDTTVEHAPDVAATLAGCTVTATVEDESDVAVVHLHHGPAAGGPTEQQGMREGAAGWTAPLPGDAKGVRWWVTATDARGNVTRGPESILTQPCSSL